MNTSIGSPEGSFQQSGGSVNAMSNCEKINSVQHQKIGYLQTYKKHNILIITRAVEVKKNVLDFNRLKSMQCILSASCPIILGFNSTNMCP